MIWALLGAVVVGVSLGLLGSGGAILTVPILVYLLGHGEKSAIIESLAIVGAIAAAGMVRASLLRRVDFRSALLLAVPGLVGSWIGTSLARHISGGVQLMLLAALMLTAAVLMFKSGRRGPLVSVQPPSQPDNEALITPKHGQAFVLVVAAQGLALGTLTGLVGIGGGFLIVPLLVLVRRLPMTIAIGTSLAVITVNAWSGFVIQHLKPDPPSIDTGVVFLFALLGIAGSLLGGTLSTRIAQHHLKRGFAVFLVVLAGYIVAHQTLR